MPLPVNDNVHVEQTNWSHVRQLFDYARFENAQLVDLMNDLYTHAWSPLHNHFCPTLKLREKSPTGVRSRKTYHAPQTPFQRIMECPHIAEATKERLAGLQQTLNPFDLKQHLEAT